LTERAADAPGATVPGADVMLTLIEHAPDGIFVADRDGRYLYVNDAGCAMAGCSRQELLALRVQDTVRPSDADRLERARAAMAQGPTGPTEWALRRKDGSVLPVEVTARILPDGQWQGFARDISGRKALEAEREALQRQVNAEHGTIRDSERLLKSVFDLLPVGIWIADGQGVIVGHNPAAERIWCGAPRVSPDRYGEFQGWRAGSGKSIAASDWALARAIRDGETCTGELVRIRCFDGTFKTIINSAAPLRGEDGRITGGIALNEDITGLHDAQERLRASEQLFRTVFDLLPVGLWIADRDGRITRGNPAGHRIWQGGGQMGPEHYGRQKGWRVDTGQPIAPEEWGIPRALRHGETSTRDLIRIQCFDGSMKTVINWAGPIRSESGEITGAIAVNEDVTALHQTQEQLRAAVRDREEILALVTHDLRSPLGAIMTLAATVALKAQQLPGGEPVRAMADNMMEISRQMSALVNDLLSVAVVRTDGAALRLVATRSPALLERAARATRPVLAREGISFDLQAAGELPVVHVDPDRILRVFANLLDNARKFTDPGGQVVLSAEPQSAGVRFCVSNSGPPLPTRELESMFQPFWQAGRGDLRGTGLGLSICRAIVEAHGGSIWAEAAAGKRVRICFLLPCAPAALPLP